MSTINKIISLLSAQNKKQKELTDYLGISKNSFTDWKSGRIKSYTKYIPQIAEYLGVTTDYLLGRAEIDENFADEVSVGSRFNDIFERLCREKGVSPNAVAKQLSISSGSVSEWKKGRVPQNAKLRIIAEYFNVSTDYLLGKTDVRDAEIEKMTTYSYNGEEGTAEQGFNAEQLNDINKLMKAAKQLSPEKLAALIQVAENMK